MELSVLFPSRGRPEQLMTILEEWDHKSSGKIDFETIVVLDLDDPMLNAYIDLLHASTVHCIIVCPSPTSVNSAMNIAARQSKGDVIICSSDDFGCEENWDQKVMEHFRGRSKPTVLMINDGIQAMGALCTLPTCNRVFYEDWGYIYWEEYAHYASDTDFTERAKRFADVIIDATLFFEHRHPDVGKAEWDNTHRRNIERDAKAPKNRSQILYERIQSNFGR